MISIKITLRLWIKIMSIYNNLVNLFKVNKIVKVIYKQIKDKLHLNNNIILNLHS